MKLYCFKAYAAPDQFNFCCQQLFQKANFDLLCCFSVNIQYRFLKTLIYDRYVVALSIPQTNGSILVNMLKTKVSHNKILAEDRFYV